jgi:hypothetical protein
MLLEHFTFVTSLQTLLLLCDIIFTLALFHIFFSLSYLAFGLLSVLRSHLRFLSHNCHQAQRIFEIFQRNIF